MKKDLQQNKTLKFCLTGLLFLVISFTNLTSLSAQDSEAKNECRISLQPVSSKYQNLQEREAFFLIKVENKGSTEESVTLSVQNNNENCANPDNSNSSGNITLAWELLEPEADKPLEKVSILPGDNFTFRVKAVSSPNDRLRAWSCAELKAVPAGCPEKAAVLNLFTYNPHPSPEE